MCNRHVDRPIFAEAVRNVGTSNSVGEVLEQMKLPNILKKENHNSNTTVGIDFKSVLGLYVLIMSRTCFRGNPHSIVA